MEVLLRVPPCMHPHSPGHRCVRLHKALACIAKQRVKASCSIDLFATTTIKNSGDATALASCRTFSGSIAIATDTTDNIALDGIRTIVGDLVVSENSEMKSLSASDLGTISGSFVLNIVEILTTLDFPSLSVVNAIEWYGVPNLQGLSSTTTIRASSLLSIQNTQLHSLDGISLDGSGGVANAVVIVNNPYLNNLTIPIREVSTSLTVHGNGASMSVALPNLVSAKNITLANCTSAHLPALATVQGTASLSWNYFNALYVPNLTSVDQSLLMLGNEQLVNLTMSSLRSIRGDLHLSHNGRLKIIDGFTDLKSVGGDLSCSDGFTEQVSIRKASEGSVADSSQRQISIPCQCERRHDSRLVRLQLQYSQFRRRSQRPLYVWRCSTSEQPASVKL